MAASACSARPHDVVAARELLRDRIETLPRLRAIVGDRAYRGLERLAARRQLGLDIKAPPVGISAFVPIRPLVKAERALAELGRWRRLPRCYDGGEARRVPAPGSKSPRSATSPGARSPDKFAAYRVVR